MLLNAGDLMVFNDTRVMNARLFGEKATGGKLELLVERVLRRQPGGGPHACQQKARGRCDGERSSARPAAMTT